MITDVGSTNDFFSKPDAPSKRAEQSPSEVKSTLIAAGDKKAPTKSEFQRKLKDADKSKTRTEPKDSDRFSKSSTTTKTEAPIQKRAPASEKTQPNIEMDSFSDEDAKPISLNGRYSGPQETTGVPSKKSAAIVEDQQSQVSEDTNIKEPDIRLLTMVASPQFDAKELTPNELKEVKEVLRDQQAQVKQASVQKFMTQLQSQFGITPDKVVQAFAKMDEKALAAPPNETISQFVSNLDVKGPARSKVADLYKQMLGETGEAALNEKLLGSDDDSKSVSLKVLDTTQAKVAKLNKSLDNLSDNFFRRGEFLPQNNQQIPQGIREQLKKLTEAKSQDDEADETQGLGAMLAQLGDKAGELAAATGAAASADTATAATSSAAATSQAPISMSAFAKQMPNQSQNFGQDSQEGSRGTKTYANQSATGGNGRSFGDVVKMSSKTDGAQVKAESASSLSSPSATAAGAGAAVGGTTAAILSPEKMMMNGPSKQEAADNVTEVIKQAQIIIKKGGGEMNVEMKPEGMGQVHLKVALENGQVSIQMMAQNDKVKKLLEDGIHELKSNLASHKLQVESLKIGIANGLQDKKMEQQQGESQREAMREAQREAAGNFASDMRDQRQDRNSAFTDVPGWKAYRTDTKRVSVEASPEQVSSVRKRDENRRLSLMA